MDDGKISGLQQYFFSAQILFSGKEKLATYSRSSSSWWGRILMLIVYELNMRISGMIIANHMIFNFSFLVDILE